MVSTCQLPPLSARHVDRLGRFRVTGSILRNNWKSLHVVFAQVVVIDVAECANDVLEYKALSEHFEPVVEGEPIPLYDVWFNSVQASVTFKKVE